VIGHIKRTVSFGRGYSKSQIGTRHIYVRRGTVADVDALTAEDRRAVERELRRRDKLTRETAAERMLASYAVTATRTCTRGPTAAGKDRTTTRRAERLDAVQERVGRGLP
jgi:hypothetical protein